MSSGLPNNIEGRWYLNGTEITSTAAQLNQLTTAATGSGAPVLATSPTLVTPSLGVASATSINFGGTALSQYQEGVSWTPTITLVGGAGNTVPVYTTTTARATRIGNMMYCDLMFSGDGGNEGAGTGTFTVALPASASASIGNGGITPVGYGFNNASSYQLYGALQASASTMGLFYFSAATTHVAFTGAEQNNTTREIRLRFFYEV